MGSDSQSRVLKMLELFNAEDIGANVEEISTYLHEDATYQPVTPLAPVVKGRSAIAHELRQHAGRYKNCVCTVHTVSSNDRHVFTERTDTVTQLHDGSTTSVDLVGVFEVDEHGLVVAWREYWDLLAVSRQMGVSGDDIVASLGAVTPSSA
jgi:limonene-1,2-epoxide hydrolase